MTLLLRLIVSTTLLTETSCSSTTLLTETSCSSTTLLTETSCSSTTLLTETSCSYPKQFFKEAGLLVEDSNDQVLNMTEVCLACRKYKCMQKFLDRGNCSSVPYSNNQALCRIHVTSHKDLNFVGNTSNNDDWSTYIRNTWKVIA